MSAAQPALPDPLLISSSATRRSANHDTNEDAFLDLPDAGLFLVADGMGGHAEGAVASRSIVEFIARVVDPGADLEAKTEVVTRALRSVAAALWRESQSRPGGELIGSTVAALLLGDGYAVCLWAGDSRIYLRRAGELFRLTRDHNVARLTGAPDTPGSPGAALTRAVGASEELELERIVTTVEPGDVLLVCTDGLTKVLADEEIGALLDEPTESLADRLVALAVARGARDDVTAVVVRCDEAGPAP